MKKLKFKFKKIGFNWFENSAFNKWINFTMYLVFILISVILIKVIIEQFIPSKPPLPLIVRGSPFLLSYLGLPFMFWFLLGLGLAIGLAFHGFKLFSINIEKNINDEKKK